MADIGDLTFPTKRSTVPIEHCEAVALLRYVEEVKMYANIEQQRRESEAARKGTAPLLDALQDPAFLDVRHEEMMGEWKASDGMRGQWLKGIESFIAKLETVLPEYPAGAFIKLSVRSPKDAVFKLASFRGFLEEKLSESHRFSEELALSEEVAALKYASCDALE